MFPVPWKVSDLGLRLVGCWTCVRMYLRILRKHANRPSFGQTLLRQISPVGSAVVVLGQL